MKQEDIQQTSSAHEVSDKELFDRIAVSYCRKDLVPSSQLARKLRLQQTMRLANLPNDAAILEVGCGAGFAARYLQGTYSRFLGVDYSSDLVSAARDHNQLPGVTFEAKNIHHVSTDELFDCAFMIGVLHHMDDMVGALCDIRKFLKPGGVLLANEPQPGNLLVRTARSVRKRIDRAYSDEQLELSKSDLVSVFKESGLQDIQVVPQGVFSTPFAEVIIPPQFATKCFSRVACQLDRVIETRFANALQYVSWNFVVAGTQPK